MIGVKIKTYLLENGIKQIHLAKQMELSSASLGEKLNGKTRITVEEYFLICNILGVPLDLFKDNNVNKAS